MTKFSWKTKGQTLLWLDKKVEKSSIPFSLTFKLSDWKKSSYPILKKIKQTFKNKNIAIRSSSINEDTLKTSNAGVYESFLNISSNKNKLIAEKINKVFESYGKKNNNDEVLIQEMIEDIAYSGVIFTHEIKNKAPYYSINYDDISGSSNTVTSGTSSYSNKTLYIHRGSLNSIRSERFSSLLKSTFEIESLFNNKELDIEFVVTKTHKIYVLQVRPIVSQNTLKKNDYLLINKYIKKLQLNLKKNYFTDNNSKRAAPLFGQMPDWNPAEIIGVVPRNLAYSLYEKLITKEIWCLASETMGYKKANNRSLMYNFSGHPFIDVRASFYSFIPKKLGTKITNKLVNFWVNNLKLFPALHDKIEFEIAITTYSFGIQNEIKKLPKDIFSSKEKQSIEKVYYQHFLKLITSKSKGSLKSAYSEILKLNLKLEKMYKKNDVTISELIKLCRLYGTLPFAKLARHAFIGTKLIKSLEECNVMKASRISEFLSSIKTILSEMLEDIQKLKNNSYSIKEFKAKYGHLRPGTYDITSKCYREIDPIEVFGDREIDKNHDFFKLTELEEKKINKVIKDYKFPFNNVFELLNYIKLSIQAREFAKFNFTRVIDLIFKNVKKISKYYSININDLPYLRIQDIILLEKKHDKKFKKNISEKIKKNKKEYNICTYLRLPQLIMDPNHSVIIPFQVSLPNFITNKIIEASCKFLVNYDFSINLDNKIVFIESADPGYDWLFTTKFSGLITKYGGTNSHMAIRCAELNIPAAIGCGEQLFEQIKKCNKIKLNCASSIIQPL